MPKVQSKIDEWFSPVISAKCHSDKFDADAVTTATARLQKMFSANDHPDAPLNTGDTTMTTYIDRTVNDIGLC